MSHRLSLLKVLKPTQPTVYQTQGLTEDGEAKGRPVDILELPDESILVSDDLAGAIYRLTKN